MYDYSDGGSTASLGVVPTIIMLVFCIFVFIAVWKIYTKAGRKGIISIVPIYNMWVLFEIAGMKGWYALLIWVPILGFILSIMLYVKLAKAFGKDTGFAVGMIFLPVIFIPILGYGKSEYVGPDGISPINTTPTPMPTGTMGEQPTEPTPMEPTMVEAPAPMEAPTEPTMAEPTPVEPVAPAEPTPMEPVMNEPTAPVESAMDAPVFPENPMPTEPQAPVEPGNENNQF